MHSNLKGWLRNETKKTLKKQVCIDTLILTFHEMYVFILHTHLECIYTPVYKQVCLHTILENVSTHTFSIHTYFTCINAAMYTPPILLFKKYKYVLLSWKNYVYIHSFWKSMNMYYLYYEYILYNGPYVNIP